MHVIKLFQHFGLSRFEDVVQKCSAMLTSRCRFVTSINGFDANVKYGPINVKFGSVFGTLC